MIKHTFSTLPIFICIALVAASCDPQPATPEATASLPREIPEPATLVLRGGKVATADEAIGEVEAVAVRGHEIVAAGSNRDIASLIGPVTQVIELEGRFVMPGFIEGHGHYLYLGKTQQILDLGSAQSWDEIVHQVSEAAAGAKPGDWIQGFGWHQEKWIRVPEGVIDGVPRNDRLNQVAPDNPVLLTHASGHAMMANDAALASAGIGDLTDDMPGGTIVRTSGGKATGLLRETAQNGVKAALAQWESQRSAELQEIAMRERAELAAREALRHGVTSFHDAGASFDDIDFLKKLESEGQLPVRLYVMVRYESIESLAARLPDYRMLSEENDFLTVRSIKKQVDGALGSHGAWLLEPYFDLSDTAGLVLDPIEEIERTAELALRYGFQVNTHAIGDRANREILDLYQRAFVSHDMDGAELRWRMEHAQHLDPVDVPRFAELGVLASMQGVHAISDGPWLPSRLGDKRTTETSYVWRNLMDSGARINNGTDVPVESIDPIASFHASVSRMMNNGKRLTPGQAMSRQEALESYTINNAYAAFEEEIKGTLTPGKLADMVVLSQNIMTVPEEKIPETQVEMTIVGGEIKYRGE
jgi:predicted amidohydrolase YtcJ